MFSYYGSKSKIVDYYPPPKYKRIIEPFAGSARYSLKYWQNDVDLYDVDEIIIKLWKWLQICSKNDIIGLPNFKEGQRVSDFKLTDEEKIFCGFLVGKGLAKPQDKTTSFTTTKQPTWIPTQKKRIANDLFKIKHWKINYGCYKEISNEEATWFIDPPYQIGGEHYRHSNKDINYKDLSEWCKKRLGQTIVCENSKADWMPFVPITKMQGTKYNTTEVIWSNYKTNFDNIQQSLF